MFSRDVTAAVLVLLKDRTAAMLMYLTNLLGIELYYHANETFSFVSMEKLGYWSRE